MHKASTAVLSNSLALRPESYNTGYVEVRTGNLSRTRACYGALERREIPRSFIARFHTKYKRVEGGCWLWQAGKFPKGYGMVNLGRDVNRKQHTEYAHRVAYVLAKGTVTAGSVVRHKCDTPACVNPDHLILGTQGDNVQDAARQGHYNVPHVNSSHRKLTDAQVALIRMSPEKAVRLAELFGVSKTTISLIRNNKRRKAA